MTAAWDSRSEEHTSELQSRSDLVCRLLLEKKKTTRMESDAQCRECPPQVHRTEMATALTCCHSQTIHPRLASGVCCLTIASLGRRQPNSRHPSCGSA